MGQLHELLAVEGDLGSIAQKTTEEAITTFTKKPDTFRGQVRSVAMYDVSREGENEVDNKTMGDTVPSKIAYVNGHVAAYWDAMLQKEETNQHARADLIVDGKVLAENLPATFLLGLENRLRGIRQMYQAMPTLDPGTKWEADANLGDFVYVADPKTAQKTEKTIKHKVLVEATDKHPAQIEKWTEDVPVGKITVVHHSGMISVARKSELLGRIDKLLRAVKKARQRANTQEVVDRQIGAALFDYING